MATIALVGSRALLASCAPARIEGHEPIAAPDGLDHDGLRATGADAVVAFEPTAAERALVDAAGLPALMWWPEAVPHGAAPARPDQRFVAGGADDGRAWRSVPLPVADGLFGEPDPDAPARAAWIGPPTPRREAYLRYFGDEGEPPADEGAEAAVAVNLHDDERPACEHRALRALAQGRLLVSETLAPARGLEPGIDYLEARDFDDLFLCVEAAARAPGSFRRMRLRGRRKAELFRASRVVPRLVDDLLLELGAR